jgi:phage-related protein
VKPVEFLGNSYDDLRSFPKEVRRALGLELRKVQSGEPPSDFKPMPTVGRGVYEIRVHLAGAWRLLYVAKFVDAIWVLHVFQKKEQKTSKHDLNVAQQRYRSLGGKQ